MSGGGAVAILAALPREVRGLVGKWRPDPASLQSGIHLYRFGASVVVTAGMGTARVSLAFQAALEAANIYTVYSVGLAGGCGAGVVAGSVYEANLVVSAGTGERFRTAHGEAGCILATTDSIAGVQEKARLAATYNATMVDMEAATVARLAGAHGLDFRAIKGISDPHDFELASLARFAGTRGQFRTAAFAVHTALRPHHWRPAAQLGRHSNQALRALNQRLSELLSQT